MEYLEKDLFLPEKERKKVLDKYHDFMYFEEFDEDDEASKTKPKKTY